MIRSIIYKLRFLISGKFRKRKIHPRARVGVVSTMPRSGTVYNKYFFHFYDQLLLGRNSKEIVEEILTNSFPTNSINDYGATIGIDAFTLTHFNCPAFNSYKGKHLKPWKALNDWGGEKSGFDIGGGLIKSNEVMVDPSHNPQSRIVYIYRNPLDQAVSFFHHTQNQRNIKYYTDALGNEFSFSSSSVKDYFLAAGLDAYIKQFFTFYAIKSLFPDNIFMLTYEALMRNPKDHFGKMLKYFGHDPDTLESGTYFNEALQLASRDSMKNIEGKMGRSLSDDQDPTHRHIRDSRTGKWREHFNDEVLKEIEQRLAHFDLSLYQFDLDI
ncbi:sulfotransferase domain-containing protein [Thermodesulfobacteriota bacterium]